MARFIDNPAFSAVQRAYVAKYAVLRLPPGMPLVAMAVSALLAVACAVIGHHATRPYAIPAWAMNLIFVVVLALIGLMGVCALVDLGRLLSVEPFANDDTIPSGDLGKLHKVMVSVLPSYAPRTPFQSVHRIAARTIFCALCLALAADGWFFSLATIGLLAGSDWVLARIVREATAKIVQKLTPDQIAGMEATTS